MVGAVVLVAVVVEEMGVVVGVVMLVHYGAGTSKRIELESPGWSGFEEN